MTSPDKLTSMGLVTNLTTVGNADDRRSTRRGAGGRRGRAGGRACPCASSPTSPSWRTSSTLYATIWGRSENPPVTLELLRAFTKAGNYVGGAFEGDRLVGACVGFFHAPGRGRAAQPHRRRRPAAQRAAASGSRSSCTSGRGRCCAASPRSPGPSTRWSAATPTSTWSSWPRAGRVPAELLRPDARHHQRRRRLRPAAGALAAARPRGRRGLRRPVRARRWSPTSSPPARSSRSASAPTAHRCRATSTARPSLVAVPRDIEALRDADPALAQRWRVAVRESLAALLADGGRIDGFDRAGWYVVRRDR